VLISALFYKMKDISNTSSNLQQTIGKPVSIKGIGLHTGAQVTMKLYPAKIDYGIKFIRKDIKDNNVIEALWSNVSSTKLSTTISNQSGTSVSTIEHLMSALSGLHIDNIKIEIDGPEVPIMDGSSIKFVDLFDQTSIQSLNKRRKILKVKKILK
jgi:UDP-3-O-[3-hydroxymyristoyl] N-acetylglucosamine deacetylase